MDDYSIGMTIDVSILQCLRRGCTSSHRPTCGGSDFGRRLEENSRRGTDHGWGSYSFVIGKGLRRQVLGFNAAANSSALADIIPTHADCYSEKEAKVLCGFRVLVVATFALDSF